MQNCTRFVLSGIINTTKEISNVTIILLLDEINVTVKFKL